MSYATPSDCRDFSSFAKVAAKNDVELQALIDRSELIINAWTRNNFNDAPGTVVKRNGTGSRMILLDQRLRSLTGVKFLGNGLSGVTAGILSDFVAKQWWIEADVIFPSGIENIEITGDFGYAEAPDQIENATCIMVEGFVLRDKDTKFRKGSVKKEKIGDYSYETSVADASLTLKQKLAVEIPAEAQLMLRDFQRPMRIRVPRHRRRFDDRIRRRARVD